MAHMLSICTTKKIANTSFNFGVFISMFMKKFSVYPLFLVLLLCLQVSACSKKKDDSYKVVHGWPQLPEGFALGEVSGVGIDSHDHVFVFHRGELPILNLSEETGEILNSWGDGMFENSHGLSIDHQNNVWVTDTQLHQVFKFSHDGELLMTLGVKGVPGLDEEHFDKPTDLAITPNGEVYVSDGYGNSRIAKFSAKGEFLFDWGHKGTDAGEFDTPHGITLDSEGRVYIADRTNSRIQVFDQKGEFLYQWKSEELGRPWGVEVGPDGYLYVVDGGDATPEAPGRGRVLKLDTSGRILKTWGSFGSYDGQLYWGHDIAISKKGNVFVTDVHVGMRVQKFTAW